MAERRAPLQIFEGLRVVDLSSGMAGPMAAMMLADHGADVIKVEPPGGDWAAAIPAYIQWNRGKRIVRLDLHAAAAAAMVGELIRGADVVIADGNAPVVARLGLDADALAHENPGLITCSISAFGGGRDDDGTRAYEGVIAALTGRMTNLDQLSGGQPGVRYEQPAFTAAPVAAYGASQLALQGIVAALLQREHDGRGQHVSTSLVQAAMAFMMRQELGRGTGDAPPGAIPAATKRGIELCFLTAECADGRYIQMCARQDKHFRDWLTAVGLGEALLEPRYTAAPMGIPTVADVDELELRLRERMRTRTQAEWMRVFVDEFDVGADPFLTPDEFLSHPDMVANGRVADIDDPVLGTVRQLGPLVQMAATPARIEHGPLIVDDEATVAWLGERLPLPPPSTLDDRPAPLRGVTIVEVAYYVAGPLATAILAEMGARVIKVEPLDGDPYRRTGLQSAKFLHGKESVTLDLKQPQGKAILDTLLGGADVVVHSFRAAAAVKLGLDPATVLARNPGAVHLYAASYGSRGPQRDRAAFHSTPNALTGGGIKQAGRGNPPVNDSYADPGSALGAATAIMFGLWAKARTGSGQAMETTMLASTAYIHSADMVRYEDAPEWRIADQRQRGLGARYRLYECATGNVFLAAVQDREWKALLDVIDRPDLAACDDDDTLAGELERVFRSRTSAEWVAALAPVGVGIADVFPGEFDQWLEAHGELLPMDHPAFGSYWRLAAKIDLSRSAPQLRPACALGEQSCDLLGELGFDQPAIDSMIAAAVTTDGRIKTM